MKRSILPLLVAGFMFSGAAIAATASNVTSYQSGIMITGQDGANYDLDAVTRMTAGHSIDINNLDSRVTTLESAPKPSNGVDGKDGKDGSQGLKGDKGDKGEAGVNGSNGSNGVDGHNGSNGKDGAAGKDGITTIKREIDKKNVDDLNRKIKRLGAGSAAASNLHYNGNVSGYAVSVGQYESATAIAGGIQYGISNHTAATVQVSYDSNAAAGSLGLHGDF